jgi:hypothetical protein
MWKSFVLELHGEWFELIMRALGLYATVDVSHL